MGGYRQCDIVAAGKGRNGHLRYWCRSHQAPATGKYGARLSQCAAADSRFSIAEAFDLDVNAFPGGVAIWGAVPPVLDTTHLGEDAGVHVHARLVPGGPKVIDRTYPLIKVSFQRDLLDRGNVYVTPDAAVSHFVSHYVGLKPVSLFCMYCGEIHLDAGPFAVTPHKKHLCNSCGRYFNDADKGVSNPVVYLRSLWGVDEDHRNLKPANRSIDVALDDYPGGIRLWGSNPAVLWTATRAEEEGIHVHLYDGKTLVPTVDETYGTVTVEGMPIDAGLLRRLMAQRAMPHLSGRMSAIRCSACGANHEDEGVNAFREHRMHECVMCKAIFRTPRAVVSNPIIATLQEIAGKARQ